LLRLQTPLRPSWVALLRLLDSILRERQIRYLLAGGNAREILLVHVYGCQSGRVTTDLDFGVIVADWAQFQALKAAMTATGHFESVPTAAQRMIYSAPDARVVVDIVPFGGVANPDGTLAWPPDGSTVMQVLGFEQAASCALVLAVDGNLTVPIASPEGLVMLKFVAWADNGPARDGKDAVDLFTVLKDYCEVLGLDTLYDDYAPIMEAHGFDDRRAAAQVLGGRVASLLDARMRELIGRQLEPAAREKLLVNMVRGQHAIDLDGADALLAAFETGLGLQSP
jgi:predicted nucleotidyltransferase